MSFAGDELCGKVLKGLEVIRGIEIGLVGDQYVGQVDLILKILMLAVAWRGQVTRIHQADRGTHLERPRVQRPGKRVEDLRGMAEATGFDQDAIRAMLPDDPVQAGGEGRRGDTA